MMTTMQIQEQIDDGSSRNDLLEQAFDGIMRLSEDQIHEIRLLIERMGY